MQFFDCCHTWKESCHYLYVLSLYLWLASILPRGNADLLSNTCLIKSQMEHEVITLLQLQLQQHLDLHCREGVQHSILCCIDVRDRAALVLAGQQASAGRQ